MKTYQVNLYANQVNSVHEAYSQKIEVVINDKVVALQFDENNYINSTFPYFILERMVKAETGGGACLKFSKWQRQGLPESYLLSEKI